MIYRHFWRSIPYLMILVLGLILIMSLFSKFDTHPDEIWHYQTAKYYFSHWFPPKLDNPEITDSFSNYGFSYHEFFDIVYLLAGKFASIISPIIHNQFQALRLFNIFLYITLIIYLFLKKENVLIFSFLLITPQIWYIFSYFNADAFPLFLSIIILAQLLNNNSFFNKFLYREKSFIWGGIVFSLLLGLLFLSKANYYIFIIYLIFYFCWLSINKKYNLKILKKIIIIIGIAFFIFLGRYIYDISTNGPNKFEKTINYAEKIADPDLKPNVLYLSNYFPLLTLNNVFSYFGSFSAWFITSFQSFVGVYGYLSFFSNDIYYLIFFYLILLFFIYIISQSKSCLTDKILTFLRINIKNRLDNQGLIFFTSLFILATIFISLLNSILISYQPQGKYLIPSLIIIIPLIYFNQKSLNKNIMAFFILILFLLSVYSFIFTGLVNLLSK